MQRGSWRFNRGFAKDLPSSVMYEYHHRSFASSLLLWAGINLLPKDEHVRQASVACTDIIYKILRTMQTKYIHLREAKFQLQIHILY